MPTLPAGKCRIISSAVLKQIKRERETELLQLTLCFHATLSYSKKLINSLIQSDTQQQHQKMNERR